MVVPLCCLFHPKLFSKATCLPAQLSQTWACHTPAALAMPPVQFSALAVTKSPEVTSSNQRHGHKNIFWPHQLCGTHNICSTCLAGQGVQCSHHIQHCSQSNPVPCHYPSPSLPPYQELSLFHFTISLFFFFFHVHNQSILVLPVPFRQHSSGSLFHRI